jgi:hypothetical protein
MPRLHFHATGVDNTRRTHQTLSCNRGTISNAHRRHPYSFRATGEISTTHRCRVCLRVRGHLAVKRSTKISTTYVEFGFLVHPGGSTGNFSRQSFTPPIAVNESMILSPVDAAILGTRTGRMSLITGLDLPHVGSNPRGHHVAFERNANEQTQRGHCEDIQSSFRRRRPRAPSQ